MLSSGNANAATGEPGRRDAARMCELAARGLGLAADDVLVCSTGLIGIPMPMDALEIGIPKLCGELTADGGGRRGAGDDDHRHQGRRKLSPRAGAATVGGMAKGAAMLSPAMATMLAVVTTDAATDPDTLQRALAQAVRRDLRLSLRRRLPLDERHRARAGERPGGRGRRATHLPARSPKCAARSPNRWRATPRARPSSCASAWSAPATVPKPGSRPGPWPTASSCSARSTANDPYWGRVLSELGASGAYLDPEAVDIAYNGITVCRDGVACAHDEAALARAMAERDIEILCDLRQAHGEATVLTTDLSHAYIDENRRTS